MSVFPRVNSTLLECLNYISELVVISSEKTESLKFTQHNNNAGSLVKTPIKNFSVPVWSIIDKQDSKTNHVPYAQADREVASYVDAVCAHHSLHPKGICIVD